MISATNTTVLDRKSASIRDACQRIGYAVDASSLSYLPEIASEVIDRLGIDTANHVIDEAIFRASYESTWSTKEVARALAPWTVGKARKPTKGNPIFFGIPS